MLYRSAKHSPEIAKSGYILHRKKKKQWAENIHLSYKFQGTRKILCQQEKQEQESTFSISQMGSVQPCLNTLPWQENSGIYTKSYLSLCHRIHLECFAEEPSGKRQTARQFYTVSDTESQGNAGYRGPKRGKNKMNNTESAG